MPANYVRNSLESRLNYFIKVQRILAFGMENARLGAALRQTLLRDLPGEGYLLTEKRRGSFGSTDNITGLLKLICHTDGCASDARNRNHNNGDENQHILHHCCAFLGCYGFD